MVPNGPSGQGQAAVPTRFYGVWWTGTSRCPYAFLWGLVDRGKPLSLRVSMGADGQGQAAVPTRFYGGKRTGASRCPYAFLWGQVDRGKPLSLRVSMGADKWGGFGLNVKW